MRAVGILRVTHEALAAALGLRDGLKVAKVMQQDSRDMVWDTAQLLIAGDGMPLHASGWAICFVAPEDVMPRYCEGR